MTMIQIADLIFKSLNINQDRAMRSLVSVPASSTV